MSGSSRYNYERVRRPLTEEEKTLVEKNHNLIYSFAIANKLPINEEYKTPFSPISHENWYGILAQALCYAVKTWDKNKGGLSNWAYQAMRSAVLHTKKYYSLHNPHIVGSLESIACACSDTDGKSNRLTEVERILYNQETNQQFIDAALDSAEIRIILENEYKRMGKYGELCRSVLEDGEEISKMAAKLGVTRQMGWYEYQKVFMPRLKTKLKIALNIN